MHTPYVSIRQHTSAYVSCAAPYICIHHTSAYVSIRQHTSAALHHTYAYTIRQHTSAYVSCATPHICIHHTYVSASFFICVHSNLFFSLKLPWSHHKEQTKKKKEARGDGMPARKAIRVRGRGGLFFFGRLPRVLGPQSGSVLLRLCLADSRALSPRLHSCIYMDLYIVYILCRYV